MLSVYHTCIIILESLIRNIYEKITAFVDQFWIVQIKFSALIAFSVLTLLVGQQEGHLASKTTEWWVAGMVYVWSEVQTCIWTS